MNNFNCLVLKSDINQAEIADLFALLSDFDKEKVSSYNNAIRRKQFIVGHGLLAKGLFELTGCYDYQLDIAESGKPYLVASKYYFSISHSANWVYVAISDKEIGIDIESITAKNRSRNYLRIAEQYFDNKEVDYLKSLNKEESLQAFYHFWTIKEAVIKCNSMSVLAIKNLTTIDDLASFKDYKNVLDGAKINHYLDENSSLAVAIAISNS